MECRNTSGNHTFVFTFDHDLLGGTAAVTSGTGSVSGSPAFSANTMTVNLTGVTDVQRINLTLSNVQDTMFQVLPSVAVSVNMLAGDTNGNGIVNATDVAQVKAQSGTPATTANFRADINANGTVNATDLAQAKANAGHAVP